MIKQIVGAIQLTIVSDRHNAIIGAVGVIFGGDSQSYCYRHVKENFSSEMNKLYRGRRRTSGIRKEVRLKLLDDIAYTRVISKFSYKRWDNITTNLAESFNAWIVKERWHNVAKLIHGHREKVARKMCTASVAKENWRNAMGSSIDGKVMENMARSIHMHAKPYRGGRVCVHTLCGALYVNVQSHECTCTTWKMTVILCAHACAAIKVVHTNVYDFVKDCYKITSQEKIHGNTMILVVTIDRPNLNDYMLENITNQVLLYPPTTSRPLGRPRIRRRESQFQNRKIYHCGQCHEARHSKRTCRNPNRS
ncbi:uncharacterized protein LOC114721287 [Neltuma alba]|uniref:uncharacterized protein LOC114721287 n=1 Tax=Neltuma alba TaxID=207710 RepID=UPI0010A4213A|nr:uncharacterized protein LOC114721287 [Prosopis alba]